MPNAVSGEGNFFLGVGFGNYEGEQGVAAGFSARLGEARNVVVNAGVASSSGETAVRGRHWLRLVAAIHGPASALDGSTAMLLSTTFGCTTSSRGAGVPVVFCHGFPGLWFSWHRQIPALAEAGCRVLVPDMRGMGQTEAAARAGSLRGG